jgi:hypothetical protein
VSLQDVVVFVEHICSICWGTHGRRSFAGTLAPQSVKSPGCSIKMPFFGIGESRLPDIGRKERQTVSFQPQSAASLAHVGVGFFSPRAHPTLISQCRSERGIRRTAPHLHALKAGTKIGIKRETRADQMISKRIC